MISWQHFVLVVKLILEVALASVITFTYDVKHLVNVDGMPANVWFLLGMHLVHLGVLQSSLLLSLSLTMLQRSNRHGISCVVLLMPRT